MRPADDARRPGDGNPVYSVYETRAARRARLRRRRGLVVLVIAVVVALSAAFALWGDPFGGSEPVAAGDAAPPPNGRSATTAPVASGDGETTAISIGGGAGAVPPAAGEMIPAASAPINTGFAGLTMFRGNARRAYYGEGPVPKDPHVLWRFPKSGPMSSPSSEGGETRVWAGTGWTGQPVVAQAAEGPRVMFGAYDRAVHFLDGDTGERFLPDLPTGDLIKGTVMLDPDGYPLLYTGSRDNYFRVVALDREKPTVLWKINADQVPHPVWNNDWDSSAVIVGDYLFEGGENSYFFIIKLNRGFDAEGKVTAKPKVVLAYPAYDEALFNAIGDRMVSIENSPAVDLDPVRGDRVYFANSGGRVLGLDISALGLSKAGFGPGGQPPGTWKKGVARWGAAGAVSTGGVSGVWKPGPDAVRPLPDLPVPTDPHFPVAFKFWTGDDVDASVVLDDEGMLYVAVELERMLPRAKELGQLMKLDPRRAGDPVVWSVKDPAKGDKGGIWATPAVWGSMLYVPTHAGRLLGVDRSDGHIVWEKPFTYHAWGSPVVVDDVLVVGDTEGWIHAYDVGDTAVDPPELWKVRTPGGGAVESTPTVWRGHIYVGSRDGYFYCFGDG